MASVLIIFGSTAGNTELVTDKVAQVLGEKGHTVKVTRVEKLNVNDFKKCKACVFASSTYSEGLLQDHMLRFVRRTSDLSFKGKKCAAIGLGDSKYNVEYVMEAASTLEETMKELGGDVVVPALRINKTPVPHLNTTIKEWAVKLSKALK